MLYHRTPFYLYVLCSFLVLGLGACEGCNEGPDRLSITNPGTDLIGVLIDAADEDGNFTDHTLLIPALTSYDMPFDILPRTDSENAEVAAFRIGSPPVILNPVFFREGHDVVSIPFEDEIVMDFTVWVLDVGATGNSFNDRTNEVIDGLAWCESHWLAERMGVRIGDVEINDVRNDPDASTLRDHEAADDPVVYFDNLSADIGEDTDRINIYLTRKVNGSRQYAGSLNGDNQIAMGMHTGEVDILIYQMGNLCMLNSVDGNSNFNSENVAKSIGSLVTRRQYMTEGQVFRCHTNSFSPINDTYNARPGRYQTNCNFLDNDVRCPPVEKRIWADGNAFPAN